MAVATGSPARAADPDAFWTAHVEPVLQAQCAECHRPGKTKSGLDVSSPATLLQGGDRGPAVVPGRPSESLLQTVLTPDADPHMPPKGQVSDGEAELIGRWIAGLGGGGESGAGPQAEESVAAPPREPLWVPPSGIPVTAAVDGFLGRAWKLDGVRPARAADDAAFVRRVHLDLVGRIPSVAEATAFLSDRRRDRRERLVDALLEGGEHARHLREVFDVVLMGRAGPREEREREDQQWFGYLESVFRENRPWDAVVRELVVARPEPARRGAVRFLWERKDNPQAMAEAVAPLVFGVQVQCAQCHDHMVAREIKQAHYWGLVAAFNRSRNVDTESGPGVAESAVGGFVTFANLHKESQPARMVLFNGRTIGEPWPAEGEKQVDDPSRYRVPPPAEKQKAARPAEPIFSRREALADAVTVDNPLLARAMVNRVWALVFGRGLVHPVELMDSKHPPSHPELLDWLAADFAASGHDVRRLVRSLVLSRAYGLDSRAEVPSRWRRWLGARRPVTGTDPDTFARAATRPLSAEQLYRSLLVATGNGPDPEGRIAGRAESEVRRAFVREFPDLFAPEYNATLQQALFLSNSPLVATLLEVRPGNLMDRMVAMEDPRAQVGELFRSIHGRSPDREEEAEALRYLADRPGHPGISQLAWALLTSAEFQLNH